MLLERDFNEVKKAVAHRQFRIFTPKQPWQLKILGSRPGSFQLSWLLNAASRKPATLAGYWEHWMSVHLPKYGTIARGVFNSSHSPSSST